ncbi:PKD domain-containing protein [Archangium violaceum]|uniref:PKD domain-containing protein n=1 Tax=Archangium violaceum TaxID=83451 RepID=UPI0036DBF762
MVRWFRYPAALMSVAAVVFFASACTADDQAGSAQFVATIGQELSAADIASMRVTVTGTGMDPMVVSLSYARGQWQALMGGISAGANRTFLAEAFDGGGVLRYRGQASSISVATGETAAVYVLLQQVDAPVPFSNTAPVIDWLTASRNEVEPGASVALAAAAHDANPGNTLTYSWYASGGRLSSSSIPTPTWTAPTTVGTYTLQLSVIDNHTATNTISFTVRVSQAAARGAAQVSVGFSTWPEISAVYASPARMTAGQTASVSARVVDTDGDVLTYAWSTDCQGSFSDARATSPSFTLSAVNGPSCTLTLSVSDGRGGTNTGSITIQTGPASANFAPQINSFYQASPKAAGGESLLLSVAAQDPEGGALTYTWSATAGTLSGQINSGTNSSIRWKAPDCFADATVTVTITDAQGATTSRVFAIASLSACAGSAFQVTAMSSSSCTVVADHSSVTLDDRGGIAVTGTHLFYNGDSGLGRFNINDLSGGTLVGAVHDSIFSNLANGMLWVLWDNTTRQEINTYPSQVTHLRQLTDNGADTGQFLLLSTPITLGSGTALFASWNKLVIYSAGAFYSVNLQTGQVTPLGTRTLSGATRCENWASWGVAEYVNNEHYVLYVSGNTIRRMRISDGLVTDAFPFTNLSDMCSFTVSPATGRWYWHYEYEGQWGGTNENIGSCPVTLVKP